jgi:hypothetical protein
MLGGGFCVLTKVSDDDYCGKPGKRLFEVF